MKLCAVMCLIICNFVFSTVIGFTLLFMNFRLHSLLTILLAFIATIGLSQNNKDTILLIDGNTIITTVVDTAAGYINYKHSKRADKIKKVNRDQVFSITDSTGEQLIYVFDTAIWNDLSINEMRYYIRGKQDAVNSRKGNGALAINFILSTGACITGNFFSPIIPFITAGILGRLKVKIKEGVVSDPEYLTQDSYLMGFEHEARRKRKIRSLLGGTVGMVVGLGTFFYLKDTDQLLIK